LGRTSGGGHYLPEWTGLASQARIAGLALDFDRDGSIVLRPTRRKYELSELVSKVTSKNRHRETEWGQPQGEESW